MPCRSCNPCNAVKANDTGEMLGKCVLDWVRLPFMPSISDCSLWPDVIMWQHGRGGLRFGGLTGLFYGVQMISSIARNRRDMQDTIWAALLAGAVMGASGESP